MAEFIYVGAQTVAVGQNVLFNETTVPPCCKVAHRKGSGIFTLKGGRYLVAFGANVSGATANTQVILNLKLNGEPVSGASMVLTPNAANDLNNASRTTYIDVPNCCCYTLSVGNTGTTANTVSDASLVIIREDKS